MNILVIGAGVIGSYLTHALCAAGNDVALVARGSWGEMLRERGLTIRHVMQHSTTTDRPEIISRIPAGRHFDAAFSVMRQDQQVAALPELATIDCDILVLVGNDLRGNEIEPYLRGRGHARDILFGFQSTAGNREGDHVVCFRMGATGLDVGPLHGQPTDAQKALLGRIFTGKYRPHWTHDFDDWLLCHAIAVIPLCFMSYLCDCDLHKTSNALIGRSVNAVVEGYALVEHLGYQILPESDRDFIRSKAKLHAWHGFLWVMGHTSIGTYCIDDHCKHAPDEMASLDREIDKIRKRAPKVPMTEWDALRSEMGGWDRVLRQWGNGRC